MKCIVFIKIILKYLENTLKNFFIIVWKNKILFTIYTLAIIFCTAIKTIDYFSLSIDKEKYNTNECQKSVNKLNKKIDNMQGEINQHNKIIKSKEETIKILKTQVNKCDYNLKIEKQTQITILASCNNIAKKIDDKEVLTPKDKQEILSAIDNVLESSKTLITQQKIDFDIAQHKNYKKYIYLPEKTKHSNDKEFFGDKEFLKTCIISEKIKK